ncbi:hypothetical protein EWM64_g9217 [Hericium alpestre]|uniref:Protein kinase domain-containing protein n=1 Tax=Hericium alpestre TaxID=135208 RepID=A0A4Y9ZJ19_9AGAM|nr:hypothetical protein EWM64_g9217 [Hericium alpestre]
MPSLSHPEYQQAILAGRKAGTPSSNSKSVGAHAKCQDKHPVHDGCHVSDKLPMVAPPVELYHPVFAKFLADVNNPALVPPDNVVQDTAKLMRHLSEIHPFEAAGEPGLRRLLRDILSRATVKLSTQHKTGLDLSWVSNRTSSPLAVVIISVGKYKRWMDIGGNPSVQASYSYEADCVIPSNSHVIDDAVALHAARIFHSLCLALDDLDKFYLELTPPSEPNNDRFFLSVHTFVSDGGRLVKFQYLEPLEKDMACMAFRAVVVSKDTAGDDKRQQGKGEVEVGHEIVVKFAERYRAEAHRLLADVDLAPKLFYCGDISSDRRFNYSECRMIVMQYVKGQMLTDFVKWPGMAPAPLCTQILQAISHLHAQELVHGDLRGLNIMICDEVGDARVKVINFDWAGEVGKVRYPLHLSRGLWVDSVQDYGFIQQVHDLAMLAMLKKL